MKIQAYAILILTAGYDTLSGMSHPAVKRPVDETMRQVRAAVINQSADNAHAAVGIALFEEERIGCEVPAKFDLARTTGIPLPAFEALQTLFERLVADTLGVLHDLIAVLLTHDFHNNQILEFCLFPHFGVLFQKEHPLPDIMQQRFSVADRFHNVVRSANILQHFQ